MATQPAYLATHTLRSDRLSFDLARRAADLRAERGEADRRGETLIKESGLNIVLTVLRPGARIGGRDTPGACAVQVIDGRVRVQSPEPELELAPGELAVFDATIGQEVVAIEEATLLLTVAMDRQRALPSNRPRG